jgi:hypothetical protein
MRPFLAAVLLVGLYLSIVEGNDAPDDDPPGANVTLPPDRDYRLAMLTDARSKNIGILSYYPNKGGGYTFVRGKQIVFYSLPYLPTTYVRPETKVAVRNGWWNGRVVVQTLKKVSIIGTREMPFGGQTVYHSQMEAGNGPPLPRRADTPIAKWTRDTPNAKFRLSIMTEDHETRLKLKSIIPVLEQAPTTLSSKP